MKKAKRQTLKNASERLCGKLQTAEPVKETSDQIFFQSFGCSSWVQKGVNKCSNHEDESCMLKLFDKGSALKIKHT